MIKRMRDKVLSGIASSAFAIICVLAFLGPYIFHIITCFVEKAYLLLLIGIIIFPIGWFHGLGAYMGWW